jgi:hypothetical protein
MFNACGTDPSLDELFGDTAMRLLMRRDGVTESDVRTLLWKLKDARALALGATKRGHGATNRGGHLPDRRETVVITPTGESSQAGAISLRFI